MLKKIILPLVTLLIFISAQAQNNVALYENCNYTGKKSFLAVGTFRKYQMGISNDQLSSMQIPNGMRVTIYEHDDFTGRSMTYTGDVYCLGSDWNDNASSVVVESLYGTNSNSNDYVTFYNDCYSKGFSQSLRPGTYSGNQLGQLRYNISSFTINGNLRVKAYRNNTNAAGYSTTYETSQSCLSSTMNDKIGSLVIEYKPTQPTVTNSGNSSSYATIYADCNYSGSSFRLAPGYYQGDKLGLMKFNISSIEIPSNLRAKVFVNNETLSGASYTLSESSSCLSNTLNNRIGSLIIEERTGSGYNPQYQQGGQQGDQQVVLYMDENYKGLSSSVLPGSYATMAQAGFTDNALSSLTLPQGYKVVLYEFENFKGKSYTIQQSKTGFLFSGWNDKASSMIIYRN